jgi:hypothetical protein
VSDLDKVFWDAYNEGARYVLDYLAEVFEEVKDTDVWNEFYPNDNQETE